MRTLCLKPLRDQTFWSMPCPVLNWSSRGQQNFTSTSLWNLFPWVYLPWSHSQSLTTTLTSYWNPWNLPVSKYDFGPSSSNRHILPNPPWYGLQINVILWWIVRFCCAPKQSWVRSRNITGQYSWFLWHLVCRQREECPSFLRRENETAHTCFRLNSFCCVYLRKIVFLFLLTINFRKCCLITDLSMCLYEADMYTSSIFLYFFETIKIFGMIWF